jgi:prepilin-type N-terminal cleavage/methylation domain-containing protein
MASELLSRCALAARLKRRRERNHPIIKTKALVSMTRKIQSRRSGFTLVEIMIVVAIIALLAAIAVPSFLRARKRSQATATLETLRLLDGAKDQYAIENGKGDLALVPGTDDLIAYVKTGTKLYDQLKAGSAPTDALGVALIVNPLGATPQVDPATKTALADALGATPDDFWGAYK